MTPHVVAAVEQPGPSNGPAAQPLVLRSFHPPAKELNLDPAAIQVVRDGLYDATHSPLGTSSTVFGHFPIGIAGKTGTSEKLVEVAPGYLSSQTPRGGAATAPSRRRRSSSAQ